MKTSSLLFIIVIAVILFGAFLSVVPYMRLQRRARAAGVYIKLSKIIGMKMRKTNPANIISLLIKAKRADVDVTSDMLETQYIARGNAGRVIEAIILAKQAGLPVAYRLAGAIDLSGGDPVAFVETLKAKNRAYSEQDAREAAREYVEALGAETGRS